jgi:hypothetical protein
MTHQSAAKASIASVEEIDGLKLTSIQTIDHRSLVAYRILHDVLHESWHVAKELLLDPDAPNPANRRAMMQVLVDYRQWHHREILAEVRKELVRLTRDPNALLDSTGAGSTTLSSDIDVNLKGNHTELAVALFNERFKRSERLPEHAWSYEPGVVYDVNVYAIDFMHKFGAADAPDGHRVTVMEGARLGLTRGGIADEAIAEADRRNQLATALFKVRLFMNARQWATYKGLVSRGLQGDAFEAQAAAFDTAEARFASYLAETLDRLGGEPEAAAGATLSGVDRLRAVAASKAPASGPHDHAAAAARENILMVAANRIYEEKLAEIHVLRKALKERIATYERASVADKAATGLDVDMLLLRLRSLIAEAAMYANEASLTDATVHHVVVGLQGAKEIDQQKAGAINSVHENLADVLKEAGRHGPDLGAAAFKSGKYMLRLADAAKNLGYGYIWGVGVLYDLGRDVSGRIKREADEGTLDPAAASAEAVRTIAGKTTLAELLEVAIETAADVAREYAQERAAHMRAGDGDPQSWYGFRTVAKGQANEHLLNQDMVHPADAARGKVTSELQEAEKAGTLSQFAFRLSEAELDTLKRAWTPA